MVKKAESGNFERQAVMARDTMQPSREKRMNRIKGLVAAPFTPFKKDGEVAVAVIEKLAASLVANKVVGAFVCGTTGEGVSMTIAERMKVAERWQACAGDKLRVIVHVGHTSLGDCRVLAAHAQKIGASAVGCMAPFCFKPTKAEDLVAFCAEVASAAPDLPFYYYHIPCVTGVTIPAFDFLRAAADRIPNLAGIKFTHENLMDYASCVRWEGGRFDILFGRDEMLLSGLAVGAEGAIGSTFNYAAPVYHRIIKAFKKGDLATAQAEQARANAMIAVLIRYGGMPPAGKAFMRCIGLDCGTVRLPLRALTDEQAAALCAEAEAIGFSHFASKPVA
jgi:N-acetylneuraminate lyase